MRIAVIDPDPAARRWLRLMLDEIGACNDFTEFPSVAQAAPLLYRSTYRFDWVFVNYRLPIMEIDEAVHTLRLLPCMRKARIAVTTTLEVDEVPAGCARLVKTVQPGDLVRLGLQCAKADAA